jgi:hypothetical protein
MSVGSGVGVMVGVRVDVGVGRIGVDVGDGRTVRVAVGDSVGDGVGDAVAIPGTPVNIDVSAIEVHPARKLHNAVKKVKAIMNVSFFIITSLLFLSILSY